MKRKANAKRLTVFISVFVVAFLIAVLCSGAAERVVYICDGGIGDGSDSSRPTGSLKEAVRLLADSGGKIVICGKYTVDELVFLSERSGTSNGNRTITVTSVHEGRDYRKENGAMLCMGLSEGSSNIILAGSFKFEFLTIQTGGGDYGRSIICGGYDTVFGEGIECKKTAGAPYLSVVGVSYGETGDSDGKLTIVSGTYSSVYAGNRNGGLFGNTSLVIKGGTFEGDVSASGAEGQPAQNGTAFMQITGGVFHGKVGALGKVSSAFEMVIDGGSFKKDIIANGRKNTLEISGGNMQNVGEIRIANVIRPAPPETSIGTTQNVTEAPLDESVVYINTYNGDVYELASKIKGEGVRVEMNTFGGKETEKNQTDVGGTLPGETAAIPETSPVQVEKETDAPETSIAKKGYFLGSRQANVVAVVLLGALIFISIVVLAYRTVHGKK